MARSVLFAMLPLLALALLACDRDEETKATVTPTATPTADSPSPTATVPPGSPTPASSPSPSPTAPTATPTVPGGTGSEGEVYPPDTRTGVDSVDRVLDALYGDGGVEALREVMHFQPVECVEDVTGLGAPPECQSDETEGTPVEVFLVANCEGYYARREEVDPVLNALVDGGPMLYAVLTWPEENWPPGEHVFVGAWPDADRAHAGMQLIVDEQGLAGFLNGCAQSADELVGRAVDEGAEFVLPPPDGE